MCKTCDDLQRLSNNPDYLCKRCAHAKVLEIQLYPYSEMIKPYTQPFIEFTDEELKK